MINRSKLLVFILLILLVSLACAPLDTIKEAVKDLGRNMVNELEAEAEQMAQDKWDEIKLQMEDMADDAFAQLETGAEEQLERINILGRAVEWEVKNPVYNPEVLFEGYTSNDSGFISYLWELDQPGLDASQFVSEGAAEVILIDDLHMGDAINNNGYGEFGHMLMFISWVDKPEMNFSAYEFTSDGIERNNFTFVPLGESDWTIQQFENDPDFIAKGPYEAQKWVSFADITEEE